MLGEVSPDTLEAVLEEKPQKRSSRRGDQTKHQWYQAAQELDFKARLSSEVR